MNSYRAYQVTKHREFSLVDRELHDPAPGHVRIRTAACGVCHSDVLAVEGQRPDPTTPMVPGHEVVGTIDAIGAGVEPRWQVGDRVGVGFLGGQCGQCDFCRRGDFVNCTDQPQPGTTVDGGYAEIVYARASGLVRVPEAFDALTAAPLLCAGVTVFNALRVAQAPVNSLVAVQGIGGLGHLGVQYAKKMGYRVAALARGTEKARLASTLGADHYIDSAAEDPAAALTALGGATAIIATAANGASMAGLVAGLQPRGKMIVVGASPEPVPVHTPDLIFGGRSIIGSLTGSAIDNEDNLAFSLTHQIAPMIEPLPFHEAPRAYDRMMSGRARFRVVLDFTLAQ
ncbi:MULTISPECIES: alcohol dehydrogenase catalytic domain-containing protein [Mycobacteriaceae]|uniref:Alcohol dehydrogenase n=1 Tax=Mycolicibacterium parafortuitum TaxID=39692 RepID=A0A375YLT6_MYCPF|nr:MULTISPECIES: alcohol dehydrogenase catalytic domain-containing protein [Mycobacteriaceae]OMC08698.1 alcohol dehydrogenase [Mycolicibacter heraklionensis]ORB29989.1 alcohol dehydrogenase [Mycolicibacterium parafortuitum]MCK0174249.1 alcohol dehydrogenase catalytic domain-containing protein [Mycolicibacterium sp. F2034L]OBB60402.1 alcohol dehydrogenase [Mycobacterium sp. 852013-51886_SCH5428379]SRX82115.1 alcohol dehydrogenase [Actinoplanes friuliensis DSM 7358] [Mycolicibacterium parafortui